MKLLYVPWRSKYVKDIHAKKKEDEQQKDCVFCQQITTNEDEKHFILGRYKHNIVILNLHPYNTGHLMVLPIKHIKNLYDMTPEELNEFIQLGAKSTKILEEKLNCDGVNVGLNLGKAAGAGMPSHLHLHILPRWTGDTNFLPLIAETKTISFDLKKIYNDLKPEFENLILE